MKQGKNPLLKLTKNGLFVMVAALVLLTATMAWFASTSDNLSVESIMGKINAFAPVELKSYVLENPGDNILCGKYSNGLYYFRDMEFYETPVRTKIEDVEHDAHNAEAILNGDDFAYAEGWSWVPSHDFNVSLYPGEFKVFKVEAKGSSNSLNLVLEKLHAEGDNADDVYKSVTVICQAYKNDNYDNPINFSQKTLDEYIQASEGPKDIRLMTTSSGAQIGTGDTVTFIYMLGIPGMDVNNTHAAIQETGAVINIENVSIN